MIPDGFKEVPGYEGRYHVSEHGTVWDSFRDVEVAQMKTGIPKYFYCNLSHPVTKKRKLVRVHRLVAMAHIPNPYGLPIVDHIDRDKFNNHVSNLRWVDRSGNNMNCSSTFKIVYDGDVVNLKDIIRILFPEDGEQHMAMYSYFVARKGMTFNQVIEDWLSYKEKQAQSEYIKSLGASAAYYNDKKEKGWSDWNIARKQSPFVVGRDWPIRYVYRDDWEYGYCPLKKYLAFGKEWTMDVLCQVFRKHRGSVENYMRLGYPLESILLGECSQRTRRIYFNGNIIKIKEFWETYGLDPKLANKVRSKKKYSIKQVLDHFKINYSRDTIQE